MKGITNTTTSNFGTIIGSCDKFVIPKFQRDYSWELEQWADLWQDVENAKTLDDEHYMGYLVLQHDRNEKKNYIIDGQQRFTTITIMILAAIKSIKQLVAQGIAPEDNKLRVEKLLERYVGFQNPISLEYDNILHLNRNNNAYYKDYIVKLGELRNRGILASERLMKQCFEFYEDKFSNKFDNGEAYAEFITFIVDKLYFTVITVSDEMNAFKVFETLNARGVQLSSSDLLKNYLFSLIDQTSEHKTILDDLESKWIQLTANVKEQKLPTFIRYYWNASHKTIRANELFKEIRKNIREPSQVFLMLNEMIAFSDVYMALQDPYDEYWDNHAGIQEQVTLLNEFGIKQAFPLLMTANKNLMLEDFYQVLKDVVIVSFRYNIICGKNPNDIETTYNTIANLISTQKVYSKTTLKKVYLADLEFEHAFKNKTFPENTRNNKIIKYVLSQIESHQGGTNIDRHNTSNTLEHILPQHPDATWHFDDASAEQYVYRLGNQCLLERKLNNQLGNAPYSEKLNAFQKSHFVTTQKIASHYSEWTPETINARQSKMAQIATSIWRISF